MILIPSINLMEKYLKIILAKLSFGDMQKIKDFTNYIMCRIDLLNIAQARKMYVFVYFNRFYQWEAYV